MPIPAGVVQSIPVWDAIDDIETDADLSTFTGDLFVLLFDSECDVNCKVRNRIERIAVRLPGDRDLRFAFLPSSTHVHHHEHYAFKEMPAAMFLRDGVEYERCSSVDDVLELAVELFERFKK